VEILTSQLFPTLVWTTVFDDAAQLNASLLRHAYRLRDEDPAGVHNTNMEGWQSRNVLQLLDDFEVINRRILTIARQIAASQNFLPDLAFRHEAWVNISYPGASNKVHIHPNCHLSGVYYVKLAPDCGSIFFRDPRTPSVMLRPPIGKETPFTATEARFRPEEGRMYVFPAWLEHGVEVNRSDSDRVSISFNVHVARAGPG
jgi:uncharacterized protein (TIGR02466 family)